MIFDERPNLAGKPGLHALVTGVSLYRHLRGGGDKPAENPFDFGQLSSTALTAYRIYEWLIAHKDHFPVPLATVRLLLSPSPKEKKVEPALERLGVEGCTRAAFADAVHEWRRDARTNDEDMTFFYFAGHGLQRKKSDAVMLLEDFAQPSEGELSKTIALDNLFYGMAPPEDVTIKMARRQFYFVDACRQMPERFKQYKTFAVPDLWGEELSGKDDRKAPIFFAAIPGTEALARKGEQSIFSKALLDCLNGKGSEPRDEDANGTVRWQVSVYSLSEALTNSMSELRATFKMNQEFSSEGHGENTALLFLEQPPEVPIALTVSPTDAIPFVAIEIKDRSDAQVREIPSMTPHPYEDKLPAGVYSFRAKVNTAGQSQYADYNDLRPVRPPSHSWIARMKP